MKTCPACNHQNPADALICESCGDRLEISSGWDKTTIRGSNFEIFAPGSLVAERYKIVKEIGRGGMGVVYRVQDTRLGDREMALKMIHPQLVELPEARQRFEQEVNTCLDLLHPNIVRVHNLEEWQGQQFFTMEYITGRSLHELIAERKSRIPPFSLSEAAAIISPLLDALSYAHQYTIHRDIKPDNIIVTGEFPDVTVKVLDFGIAKTLSASDLTQTAQALGTAFYMAPEQMSGGEIDQRADLYSTGMVLYEMLTGEMAVGRFQLPGEFVNGLPKAVDQMFEKALAPIPEQRFPDAETMSHELQKALSISEAKIEATPGTERPKIPAKIKIERQQIKEKTKPARPAPAAVKGDSKSWLYASFAMILLILMVGIYYWNTGYIEKKLKRETSVNPQNAQAWIKLARYYLRSKQYKEAILAYQKSLKLDPQNASSWNKLGFAYRRNGDSKEAKNAYDQALNIDPRYESAWYNKGMLFFYDAKDPEGALYCWKELAKINPSYKSPVGTKIKALIEKAEKKAKTLSKKPSSRSDDQKKKLEMASRIEGVGLKAIIGEWRDQASRLYSGHTRGEETMIIGASGDKLSITMRRPVTLRRYGEDSHAKENIIWDGKNLKFTIRAPLSRGGYDLFYSLTLLDQNTLSGIKQAEDSSTKIPMEFKRWSSPKKQLEKESTSSPTANKNHATANAPEIAMKKVPAATTGRLIVDTMPEGARVRVLNIKPAYQRGMELEAGDYHIEVSHAGYITRDKWVQVKAGRDSRFRFEMEEAITFGQVLVKSKPAGAKIYLDGELRTQTPDQLERVAAGKHRVLLKLDGYEDWTGSIIVTAGREKEIMATLKKKSKKIDTAAVIPAPPAKKELAHIPVKIGLIQGLSGPFAMYGKAEVTGFKMGLEYFTEGTNQIIGRNVKLIVEDTQLEPALAKRLLTKLYRDDKVDLAIGPVSSATALAMLPVAREFKKILIVEPAVADSITGKNWNRYIFRTARNSSQDAISNAVAVAKPGVSIACIGQDYTFGRQGIAAFKQAAEKRGAKVVHAEYLNPKGQVFKAPIQRIIESLKDKPEPKYVWVLWAGKGSPLLQLMSAGLDKYKIEIASGGNVLAALKAMKPLKGMKGSTYYYYENPKNRVNDWFVKEHLKRFKEPPDFFTCGGFAAAGAVIESITKAESTDTEKLIAAMEGMEFMTPKGKMRFRKEDHQALQSMFAFKLDVKPGVAWAIPVLTKELSMEETAPPIMNTR